MIRPILRFLTSFVIASVLYHYFPPTFLLNYYDIDDHNHYLPLRNPLPRLRVIFNISSWPELRGDHLKIAQFFTTILKPSQLEALRDTLVTFARVMTAANFTYMLFAGTLLGSYRHHSFIPWDEDLDVFVPVYLADRLPTLFRSLQPNYTLIKWTDTCYRFYTKKAHVTYPNGTTNPFPFLDIYFYGEDNRTIWGLHPAVANVRVTRDTVFPLVDRPYWGEWFPAPFHTRAFLRVDYDTDVCYNKYLPVGTNSVPCKALWRVFPFVFRDKREGYVVEKLMIGEDMMDVHLVLDPD